MSWAYIYHELKKKGDPIAKASPADMGAQGWAEAAELSSDISPDCEAAAYDFLREMNSPKGQALMAESSGYTPANPGAAKYLSKELNEQIGLNDPKAFRGSAIIKLAPADPEAYNQTLQEIISGLD
jgi:spermidine/putrescine-binding protein